MRLTATSLNTNSNGWRPRVTSCSIRIRVGARATARNFGNIIQYKYPGDDFKDLMAGVDEVVRRGGIDEKKLGVTGGSGGGLLTNWVVGHTDRFAAAVAQRDIADWADWWYTRRLYPLSTELVQDPALQRSRKATTRRVRRSPTSTT